MSTLGSKKSRWQKEIARRQLSGESLECTLAQFAQSVGEMSTDNELVVFFDDLVASGAVQKIETFRCPCCDHVFAAGSVKPITDCPGCHINYLEEGEEAIRELFYRFPGEKSRDIRWMIVIHGMNSRAPWQEEFSWQIANRQRYSAPVLIYKYGWATIEVLLKPLHRRLARQLGMRIRIAIDQAKQSQHPSMPDIIAHSFGTRLFSLVLEDPEFDDLKFGRVITAGSIVRPDFDWYTLIAEGRLEAILNHVAAQDGAVPFAEYTIPGSGPGGQKGYASKKSINVCNSNFITLAIQAFSYLKIYVV